MRRQGEGWVDLENRMCGQVQRAREIMRLLQENKVPLSNDTVQALRMVADVLMDQVIEV